VNGFRTHGHAAAVEAARSMLRSGISHAILIAGPGGVGKTTLALDLAAALLCLDPDPANRPCRACRACRAIEHGNHPDIHRLAPVGPGAVIPIGGREERGVRDLVRELALMPVEGGARVAVIESADRMTEDAQSALLKTLEEPPSGAVLILCAEDDERLLPTIRSRCVRLRLGSLGTRAVEQILGEHGIADAPTAARVARIAGGRPGLALSFAGAPEAVRLRGEIARTLLDLLKATRARRLEGVRDLASRAAELARALDAAPRPGTAAAPGRRATKARTGEPVEASDDGEVTVGAGARVAPAERRAAALALVGIWRDLLRDLALVGLGERGGVRDPELLEDLERVATMPIERAADQLRRLDGAGEQLEGNVSPELVLDTLALAWHG
jgi:DNA polymerase III subunit delta'